jgi:hypothetical protein
MKAHQLLQDGVLQPDQLSLVFAAFDTAWDEVKAHYHTPTSIELARLRLANGILAAYREGIPDADALKVVGLRGLREGAAIAVSRASRR